jgi:hypothetical protein
MARGWRRLYNDQFLFCTSPSIIRVTKSKRMRLADHVARVRARLETYTKFQLENLKESDHLEDLGVDVRLILEWILEEK